MKFSIKENILPWMPSLLIFVIRPGLHSMSYAFSKSRKAATVKPRLELNFEIVSCNLRIWSRVDLFFLKPVWQFTRSCLDSRYWVRRLVISFSMTLQRHEVKEIGM